MLVRCSLGRTWALGRTRSGGGCGPWREGRRRGSGGTGCRWVGSGTGWTPGVVTSIGSNSVIVIVLDLIIYLLVEGAWQVIEQMWLLPPYQGEQVLLCQSVPGTVEM